MTNRAAKLFLVLFVCSSLHGSGKEGHGGWSVVCRDAHQTITSVRLLDLFEAGEVDSLTIPERTGSAEAIARDRLDRALGASREYFDLLPEYLDDVLHLKKEVSTGVNPLDDVFSPLRFKECKIEPVADFLDGGKVLIDREFFQQLSPTAQAALYWHEAIYRLLREKEKATDSRKARLITGHLFSSLSDEQFAAWWRETKGEPAKPKAALRLTSVLHAATLPEYQEVCRKWREDVQREMGPRSEFLYPDCGEPVQRLQGVESNAVIHVRPRGHTEVIYEWIRASLHRSDSYQTVPPEAWDDYRRQCQAWKDSLKQKFGDKLFYADCGHPIEGSRIANAYYPESNGGQRAYHLGFEPYSHGTFLIFSAPLEAVPEQMTGKRFYFTPGDLDGEASAFQQARDDYRQQCEARKAKASGVYLICESGESDIHDHPYATSYIIIDNNYWMRATAVEYRLR